MCRHATGQRVLDIGCSQGITSILLAREGMQVTGIDIFKPVIDYAVGELAKEVDSVASRVEFRCTELASLSTERFDTVIMGEVIEHQTNPGRFVAQAAQLVSPHGRIVITVPFGLHPWPDHKSTVFPSDIYEPIKEDFCLTSLEVSQGYIRMVADRREEADVHGQDVHAVLVATERGALQWQEKYYEVNGKLQSATKAKVEAEKISERLQHEKAGLLAKQGEMEKELALVEIQIESLKVRLKDSSDLADQSRNSLLTQLEVAQSERQRLAQSMDSMIAAKKEQERSLNALRNDLDSSGERERAKAQRQLELEQHASRLEREVQQLTNQLADARRQENELKAGEKKNLDELSRTQGRLQSAADAVAALQAKVSALQQDLEVAQHKRAGHYLHLEAERTRTRQLIQLLEELHGENQRYRRSIALEIGQAVLGLRSFGGIARFPRAMWRAWCGYRRRGGGEIVVSPLILPRIEPVQISAPAKTSKHRRGPVVDPGSAVSSAAPARDGDQEKLLSAIGWHQEIAPHAVPVLSVMDEFSRSCFAPHAALIEPRPDNWEGLLEQYCPRLLLVESSWKGNYGSWQYRVANYANPPGRELAEMVEGCRARGIPTVFWNKEDPVHFDNFIGAASQFDCVLTTAEEAVPRYREKIPARVGVLQFAAEDSLHNPIGASRRNGKVCFAGSFYANRFHERRDDQLMLLDAASAFDFDIFDRNHDPKATTRSDFAFPERFSRFVRGRMPYSAMGRAYREYRVFLNVNSVIDSPTMFSRRVFELLACGTPVVSTWSRGTEETFGSDLIWHVRNREEAEEAIRVLMTDDAEWRRRSLAGIRAVLSRHTFRHRFQQVLEFAGCDNVLAPPTQIVAVARVSGQSEADALMASFARQRLDQDVSAELVLLTERGSSISVSTPRTALVEALGFEAHLGGAPRTGARRLIASMSPNAVYGAHHLQDLAHALRYSGAAVVGRPLLGLDAHQYQFGVALDRRTLLVDEQLAAGVGGVNEILSQATGEEWARQKGRRVYAIDTSNFRAENDVLSAERQQEVLSAIEI
ncbi:MAG: hypothetical protein ABT16_00245 [Rhodanobacter sp. SCN 65-17]|nr:MAG: hypothetical protein ABT16_00245 [Rhodanobacter sp. SCN 65-17]